MSTHSIMIFIVLAVAVFIDCKEHRIPNWLVVSGLVLGLFYASVAPENSLFVTDALLGVLVGFLVLLPGYVLGKMGAGDVKLMATCGCYLGAAGVFNAALFTFIAGGAIGLLWVFMNKVPSYYDLFAADNRYLPSIPVVSESLGSTPIVWKQRFPYAAAIAIGCLTVMITGISVFAG